MPVSFCFIEKATGQQIKLETIDERICIDLDIPVDKEKFSMPY